MVRRRGNLAAICAFGAFLTLFTPAVSFAQDDDEGMSFGDEDVADGGDEGMSFGDEDIEEGDGGDASDSPDPLTASNNNTGSLAVVAVSTGSIDGEQRQKLQDALDEAMTQIKGYDLQGASTVLSELNDRGEECVQEQICLTNVGEAAGVDKLLLARITKMDDETYKLDLDFFDVQERLFINYEKVEGLGSPNAAIDSVDASVKRLFKVRDLDDGPIVEEKPKNEWIQPTFAYTSAGLAVACFAGGAVFGNQARGEYNTVVEQSESGMLTQRDARAQYDTASGKARRANLFYGLGVGLGVLSAVLFTVDFGSDVAEDDEYVRIKDIQVAPTVSANGGGIGTFFRF